jgi:chromate transporter
MPTSEPRATVSLAELLRGWGRIGVTGFGGPPAHVALLRELCVSRRRWLTAEEFEGALAATGLLPGPASTQLAIYCAWRLRGAAGALVGGLAFIVPGLIAILALSVPFLAAAPPTWIRGAGMGAGAAVAPVALCAGIAVAGPLWRRADPDARARVAGYALAGGIAAALTGPWVALVLLACGAIELLWRESEHSSGRTSVLAPLAAAKAGGLGALAWTAFKVGALAFGGGFVIVPLMQGDAISNHWMTHAQFVNAVALGQVTPGPVTQTVAAVGYAAGGIAWGLFAAAVAFAPSFAFVLLGARHFDRLAANARLQAFLGGAAPAAAGAIIGSAIPLAGALQQGWQYVLLALAAVALIVLRAGVVPTLLAAALAGTLAALLGAPVGG